MEKLTTTLSLSFRGSDSILKYAIANSALAKKDPDGIRRLYFDTRKPLPFFKVASSGTKALYTFFYWFKTATDVSLMFIDEFDAFYHYELSETIVTLLENMPSSQTILTSYNTNLLSNRIMRPDCYFILTGDSLTSFANATDREPDSTKKILFDDSFSDILLIFDLDPQAPEFTSEKIDRLTNYFVESSDAVISLPIYVLHRTESVLQIETECFGTKKSTRDTVLCHVCSFLSTPSMLRIFSVDLQKFLRRSTTHR